MNVSSARPQRHKDPFWVRKIPVTNIPLLRRLPGGLTVNLKDMLHEARNHFLKRESPYLDDYPSLSEVEKSMQDLVAENPDTVELVSIGTSSEGRDIKALHISTDVKDEATDDKPSVIVVANQHASEWATNGVVLEAVDKLLDGEAKNALDDLEMWIVPMANPDGYNHARSVKKIWRKNTWRDQTGEVTGVDLNRNHPFKYRLPGDTPESTKDDVGGSDKPGSFSFRGTGPQSEPEAKAIGALLAKESDAVGLLDVHSFGRLVLLGAGEHEVSAQEYKDIGTAMNEAIGEVEYTVQPGSDLYATTGTLADYADSLGMVGITLEVGTSFQPPPAERDRIVERSSDGVVEFVRQMQERA